MTCCQTFVTFTIDVAFTACSYNFRRYLALGKEREEFFELTTPLFISDDDVFSLLVPGYGVRCPIRSTLKDSTAASIGNDGAFGLLLARYAVCFVFP